MRRPSAHSRAEAVTGYSAVSLQLLGGRGSQSALGKGRRLSAGIELEKHMSMGGRGGGRLAADVVERVGVQSRLVVEGLLQDCLP